MDEADDISIYNKEESRLIVQRPNEAAIVYQMDDRGRVAELKDSNSNVWRYEWDELGNRLHLIVPTGDTWLVERGNHSNRLKLRTLRAQI